MPASDTWETNVPNKVSPLMRAIEALDSHLEQWGANADARYLAQLAVEELGTNIIKYGYDDQEEHLILLGARRERDGFQISIEDDGHEFNPCMTPEPDPNLSLEARTPGGWGLSLVRRATRMEYERRGQRNVVRIQVPRQPASLDS